MDQRRIQGIADRLIRDERALLTSLDFGPYARQGEADGPSLFIGDQSEITLFRGAQGRATDYRMAGLARPGDIVVLRRRVPAFEAYLADWLDLRGVTFLEVGGPPLRPVATLCRTDPRVFDVLAARLRAAGGLTLHAYLTTGRAWRLAAALGEAAGHPVHVAGPGPRIGRRANDKLWFAGLAREVLGRDAVPPSRAAYGPAAAAGLVARYAARAAHVVVKVPDSAGSAGNLRLDSALIADWPLARIRQLLIDRLVAAGWGGSYPVLVGIWDERVTSSPSVQMQIPLPGQGVPMVDGIFEQRVRGAAGIFVGAVSDGLAGPLRERLESEALAIAAVLQRMGYFGRCSLDAVVTAEPGGTDGLHWIECNGRWGGVSIPLAMARTLTGGAGAVAVAQEIQLAPPLTTPALVDRLADHLYRHGETGAGIVLVSPPDMIGGRSINLASIAAGREEAASRLDAAMALLTEAY